MLPTSLEELENKLNARYRDEDKSVVGIMLARYSKSNVKKVIAESYEYWHKNTKSDFDIAWIGYTQDEYARKGGLCEKVVEFDDQKIYFDMDDYIESKNILKQRYKIIKRDNFELLLVNYYDRKLHLDENIRIDLSQNQDNIDRIIELITDICSKSNDLKEIKKALIIDKFIRDIRGIKISSAIKALSKIMLKSEI